MPASPVTTEQLQDVQKEVLDLKLKFEEAMREEAEFRRQMEHLFDLKDPATSARGTSAIPGVPVWIAPLLQGLTVVVVIGAALWVGQITGTTNTRIDNLQKSVDKLNDWEDSASVSLASLNQKVDDLRSRVNDLNSKVDNLNSKVDKLASRVDDLAKAKK